MNSPRIHPSLFHTARSVEYLMSPCHYISGIVLFTTLTGQYLREGYGGPKAEAFSPRLSTKNYIWAMSVRPVVWASPTCPTTLQNRSLSMRSCVRIEIWREGCYSKACVAAPCQWLSLHWQLVPRTAFTLEHFRRFPYFQVLYVRLISGE